jgi:gamma-glutamyltranspeptidase/glutathione hydrolase
MKNLAWISAFFSAVLLLGSCRPADRPENKLVTYPIPASPVGFLADSALVVSAHPEATRIGVEILKRGGNAADAAVAVHFALAVCFPYAGNIGGGGFLVHRDEFGQISSLDFRETAPSAAHENMYLDANGDVIQGKSVEGELSSGVPGSVDGMWQLHQRHGSMEWTDLLTPAILLAEKGFLATEQDAIWLEKFTDDFRRLNPRGPSLSKFGPWKAGDLLVQPDLAQTLRRIQSHGREGFYQGETAKLLVQQMKAGNGIVDFNDLEGYKAEWRKPLALRFGDWALHTMPPPSAGGVVLIQSLQMLSKFPLADWSSMDADYVHATVEVLKRTFADRNEFIGDPKFVDIPDFLLQRDYLSSRIATINMEKATPSSEVGAGSWPEKEETTHFSIVDAKGSAISVTTTLNGPFGSKVWVQGAGFLLNNEMDDFSIRVGHANQFGLKGSKVNAIAPGKRMASSMTPTIITHQGKVSMVIGTPGGSTIPVSLLQCILHVYVHGLGMQQAVAHRRFHHQGFPDEIATEDGAFPDEVWKKLVKRGHHVCLRDPIGRVNAIWVRPDGVMEAGADPRRDDCAGGF